MFIERIETNILLKPLQTVVGIVERKQPLPILSNVLIEKLGSSLRFTATDLEIQIATRIVDANLTGADAAITVAAKKLQEILRILPDGSKVSMDIQDSRILLKTNNSRFSLQTLPAQDFPKVIEQLGQIETVEIEQQELKQLFGMVQFAMAQQDIRYYLNGVLLVVEDESLEIDCNRWAPLGFHQNQIK